MPHNVLYGHIGGNKIAFENMRSVGVGRQVPWSTSYVAHVGLERKLLQKPRPVWSGQNREFKKARYIWADVHGEGDEFQK